METMRYDRQQQRWTVGGTALHCGDGLYLLFEERWLPVRMEWQDGPGWIMYTRGDALRILPEHNVVARRAQRLGHVSQDGGKSVGLPVESLAWAGAHLGHEGHLLRRQGRPIRGCG